MCVCENGAIDFDLISGELIISNNNDEKQSASFGAQSDVIEKTYCEEIHTFIDTIKGEETWPHSYQKSAIATATLAAMESNATESTGTLVNSDCQPDILT
jgi:hypothetical protein